MGTTEQAIEARKHGLLAIDTEDMRAWNKDRKKIKEYIENCDFLLASENVIKLVPRLLGPTLSKIGKFPHMCEQKEDLQEVKKRFMSRLKLRSNLIDFGFAIGNV